MRYWVGGATGFLGTHLVKRLVEDGHEVIGVARAGGTVAGVRVESLDVLDADAVARTAKGVDGAFLVTGRVSRDPADGEEMHRANVLGTRSALSGLRQAGVGRVVYASTSGTMAIATKPDIADETSPAPLEHLARWPYYRSKLYAELDALEANGDGLEVVIVNPSLLLGPGDLRGSSTSDVRRFLDGDVLAAPRGGIAVVDVRDVAVAMVAAFERGSPGERYLLNGANLTVPAFLDRLERISGVRGPTAVLPKSRGLAVGATRLFGKAVKAIGGELSVSVEDVEMAQYYWYCDSGKAIRELGFSPRDLTETLRDTISDLVLRGVAHPRLREGLRGGGRAFAARSLERLLGEREAE